MSQSIVFSSQLPSSSVLHITYETIIHTTKIHPMLFNKEEKRRNSLKFLDGKKDLNDQILDDLCTFKRQSPFLPMSSMRLTKLSPCICKAEKAP